VLRVFHVPRSEPQPWWLVSAVPLVRPWRLTMRHAAAAASLALS
jgi:hypothetical protein